MTRIKICGLRREADVDMVNSLRPDYAGFVFAPSRRQITPERGRELADKMDPDICRVGVFVDQEPELVAGLLNEGVIRMAQLHGHEDRTYQQKLLSLLEHPHLQQLIKAVRVASVEQLEQVQAEGWKLLLLDAPGGTAAGGNGLAFDWALLRQAQLRVPFFLAGGLQADNVQAAIRQLSPFAVDVSSGVETDGVKDRSKMERFIEAVRRRR